MVGRFERHASEVGRARRWVQATLQGWGLETVAAVVELAASELVTNALVHGEGAIEVRLAADDSQVRLEVIDEGLGRPELRPRRMDGQEPGGWGLHVVDRVSDRWGATSEDERNLVWMVKRRDPATRNDPSDPRPR